MWPIMKREQHASKMRTSGTSHVSMFLRFTCVTSPSLCSPHNRLRGIRCIRKHKSAAPTITAYTAKNLLFKTGRRPLAESLPISVTAPNVGSDWEAIGYRIWVRRFWAIACIVIAATCYTKVLTTNGTRLLITRALRCGLRTCTNVKFARD